MRSPAALLVAAALCAALARPAQAQILFLGEYIDFTLTDSVFQVTALYRFANAGETAARHDISYPFPDVTTAISRIHATDVRTGASIGYERAERAIVFPVVLAGADTADILVTYEQPAKRRNIYLLTTTQQWGRALDFARYTLTVDRHIAVSDFSYPPDLREETADAYTYSWSRVNFMPDKEFVVTIEGFAGQDADETTP